MRRYFQTFINGVVLLMVLVWGVSFITSLWPYDDETIPDETIALDEAVVEALASTESNFAELYDARAVTDSYELSYLSEPRVDVHNQDNYQANVASMVYITIEDDIGWQYIGAGSILTEDGLILTNFHMIEGAQKALVTTSDGDHYPVTSVVASDELLDVAFLKIDASGLRPVMIGDSDLVRVGDETLVIGHPEAFINTLSVGNVSGIRSYASRGMGKNLQITNPISMGNSGGAVLNTYGEIIGIPTWSVEYDNNSVQVQNLNFAVPINEALALIQ